MNKRKLSMEETDQLRQIISKRLPADAERLLGQTPENWLRSDRDQIRDVVGQELAGTGFDENYDPNTRGHLLEGLIDFMNRLDGAPA